MRGCVMCTYLSLCAGKCPSAADEAWYWPKPILSSSTLGTDISFGFIKIPT